MWIMSLTKHSQKDPIWNVTRQKDITLYEAREKLDIPDEASEGVLKDKEMFYGYSCSFKQLENTFPLKFYYSLSSNDTGMENVDSTGTPSRSSGSHFVMSRTTLNDSLSRSLCTPNKTLASFKFPLESM
jgi:hypothetical protein